MLTVLLESRARRPRRTTSAVLSATAHVVAVAAVLALTVPGDIGARGAPEIHPVRVAYLQPSAPTPPIRALERSSTRSEAEPATPLPRIRVPVFTPPTITPVDVSIPLTTTDRIELGSHAGVPTNGASEPGTAMGSTAGVSDASAVDRTPRLFGRAPEPHYPPALRAAGVEGRAVAEFVVDTLGRAELATLRFSELANPLFGDAVRDALARYRFTPGEMAGRKVRTRVAVPFDFRIAK